MPIVDGLTSTKMIRSFEKAHPDSLTSRASLNGRVPIFAVSASLIEKERQSYIDAGFDGWILKPIDFKRLGVLLEGIVDEDTRNGCLYEPGEWERGGWFHVRRESVRQANTKPSQKIASIQDTQSDAQSGSSGESGGSGSTTKNNTRPLIHDERLDSSNTPDSSPPRTRAATK